MIRQRLILTAAALAVVFVTAFVATALAQQRAPAAPPKVAGGAVVSPNARIAKLEQAVAVLQQENAQLKAVLQIGSKDVTLTPPNKSGKVVVRGKDVEVKADANVKLDAAMKVDVKGNMGAKFESSAITTLKGGAQTIVQGGIVRIN